MLSWILEKFRSAFQGDRLSSKSIDSAIGVVEARGFKAHKYLAGVGSREDEELSFALDTLESAGFIVVDSNGRLVGKVTSSRLDRDELAMQRRAEFKIVE